MKRAKAFTLVELLVVIGIISVLIAMLLPALNKVRQQAKTIACASNMRQVMTALIMYANANRGSFPWSDVNNADNTRHNWPGRLVSQNYIQDPRVFFCPERKDKGLIPDIISGVLKMQGGDRHAILTSYRWQYVSYGANRYGAMPCNTDSYGGPEHPIKIGLPGPDASRFVVLAGAYYVAYAASGYYGFYTTGPANNSQLLYVHPGNVINAAYLDGHCASERPGDLDFDSRNNVWLPAANDGYAPWYMLKYVH